MIVVASLAFLPSFQASRAYQASYQAFRASFPDDLASFQVASYREASSLAYQDASFLVAFRASSPVASCLAFLDVLLVVRFLRLQDLPVVQ